MKTQNLPATPSTLTLALLLVFALLGLSVPAQAQSSTWISDTADAGLTTADWFDTTNWSPMVVPNAAGDQADIVGAGANGFAGGGTREIEITNPTATVGILRFGDRDMGTALHLESLPDGNLFIFDNSGAAEAGATGRSGAFLYHGIESGDTGDVAGAGQTIIGSDITYGTSSDRFDTDLDVSVVDSVGLNMDTFFNFINIGSTVTGNGTNDLIKWGQGLWQFLDDGGDVVTTNSNIFNFDEVTVNEGELRIDGDNTNPDAVQLIQVATGVNIGDGTLGTGERSVIPTFRYRRSGDPGGGADATDFSDTFTNAGAAGVNEVPVFNLNNGALYLENSSIGGAAGNILIESDLTITGTHNQLDTNRESNNSESVVWLADSNWIGNDTLTKDNNARNLVLGANTFAGTLRVAQQSDDDSNNMGGVEVSGTSGSFQSLQELVLFNNGTFFAVNGGAKDNNDSVSDTVYTIDFNNNRIGDNTDITIRDFGRLELVGPDAPNSWTENVGTLTTLNGNNVVEFDLNNGTTAGQITLELASFDNSDDGSGLTNFRLEDALVASFDGDRFGTAIRIALEDNGGATTSTGGGGASDTTNISIASHTYFSEISNVGTLLAGVVENGISPGVAELRPLDHNPSTASTLELVDMLGVSGAATDIDGTVTDNNVLFYGEQNTGTGTVFQAERILNSDTTVNSMYFTSLDEAAQGGTDSRRGVLAMDWDTDLTITSGNLHFGRNTDSANAIATAGGVDNGDGTRDIRGVGSADNRIAGGTLQFPNGAFIVNGAADSAFLNTNINVENGNLHVSGNDNTFFTGNINLNGGDWVVSDSGDVSLRGGANITGLNRFRIEGNGELTLRDGQVIDGAVSADAGGRIDIAFSPGAGSNGATSSVRHEVGTVEVKNADVILSYYDLVGENFGTQQFIANVNTTAFYDSTVNLYAEDPLAQTSTDIQHADPQTFQFNGERTTWNFDGLISDVEPGTGDGGTGALAPTNVNDTSGGNTLIGNGFGVTGGALNAIAQENQLFRVRLAGPDLSNDRFSPYNNDGDKNVLNVGRAGQQWHGKLDITQGIFRFTAGADQDANDGAADGSINFLHDEVANSKDSRDFWQGFRLIDDGAGVDNMAALFLTEDTQIFNIGGGDSRADTDNGEDNFAIVGYSNTTGSAQFGDEVYNIGGGFGKRFLAGRELIMYAAGSDNEGAGAQNQGTFNWRLGIRDPGTERDGELTVYGRGIVNYTKNAIADDGANTFNLDFGINLMGGEAHFDYDVAGDTGNNLEILSGDTNAASTPDIRFMSGDYRILGDTNETQRTSDNLDGEFIVNQGGSEFEVRTRGTSATPDVNILVGGPASDLIRTNGGQLNIIENNAGSTGVARIAFELATGATSGSAPGVFDSRMNGGFTYGTSNVAGSAGHATGWAALDGTATDNEVDRFGVGTAAGVNGPENVFNAGGGIAAGFAVFGAGVETHTVDAAVASTGTTTNSLLIDSGASGTAVTFSSAAGNYTIADGILITSATTGAVSFGGTDSLTGGVTSVNAGLQNPVYASREELIIHNYGGGGLTISNVIADAVPVTSPTDLTIGGTGRTDLSGVTNTYTGNTYINGGVTVISDDSNLGAIGTASTVDEIYLVYTGDNYDTTAANLDVLLYDRTSTITPGIVDNTPPVNWTPGTDLTIEVVDNGSIRDVRDVTNVADTFGFRPEVVFEDVIDATGVNHGQGARAQAVLSGNNLIFGGGVLEVDDTAGDSIVTLDRNRAIILNGDGGSINIADGNRLDYAGFIASQRHSSRNENDNVYANFFGGDLDINSDGSTGTFRLGNPVADGDNNTFIIDDANASGGPNAGDITVVNTGDDGLYNQYYGMTNVFAGEVQIYGQPSETHDADVAGQQSTQAYIQPFGDVASRENGTVFHEDTTFTINLNGGDSDTNNGATLDGIVNNNDLNDVVSIMEPFTFNDNVFIQEGSDAANSGRTISFDGDNIFDGNVFIGSDGGNEMIFGLRGGAMRSDGDTVLHTLGDNNVRVKEHQPGLAANWVMLDGQLEFESEGNPSGTGATIRMGRLATDVLPASVVAAQANYINGGTLQLYIRGENGDELSSYEVPQDISIGGPDNGEVGGVAENNSYRIGARFLDHFDEATFSGDMDFTADENETIQFYYRDDRVSRSAGAPEIEEKVFINFDGDISGDVSARIFVEQAGTGNVQNGAAEIDLLGIFTFSGDNSAWGSGSDIATLEIGNRTGASATNGGPDVDKQAFVRAGQDLAFNQFQNFEFRNNAHLQANGNDITVRNITSDGASSDTGPAFGNTDPVADVTIDNAAATPGSITINQTANRVFEGVIQDGTDMHTNLAAAALALELDGVANNDVLALNQDNTYTGNTTITQGNLQVGVGGNGAISGTPQVDVAVGARLAGTGSVGAATSQINVGGFLIPGDIVEISNEFDTVAAAGAVATGHPSGGASTIGELIILDDISIFSTGTAIFTGTDNTDDGGSGTEVDLVSVGGVLDIAAGGLIQLDITTLGGTYIPAMGDEFNLFDSFTSRTGAAVPAGTFVGGGTFGTGVVFDLTNADLTGFTDGGFFLEWDFSRFDSEGLLEIVTTDPIPEPTRALLLLLGAFGMLLRRRR